MKLEEYNMVNMDPASSARPSSQKVVPYAECAAHRLLWPLR